MRTLTVASLLVCSGLFVARPVEAQLVQISCASIDRQNHSHQQGEFNTLLYYSVQTLTDPNPCTTAMIATGSIEGIAGSTVGRSGEWAANAEHVHQVPAKENPYRVKGEHQITLIVTAAYRWAAGITWSEVVIKQQDPEPPPPPIYGPEDCAWDEVWDGFICQPLNCPIVISMDRGEGYRFTSARRGVPFDLDANGAPEQVAWTAPDTEVAFLALDRNGNGRIDDGTELFGNHTPVGPGTSQTSPNGFEALRLVQGGVPDDFVNAQDPVWSQLLLWTDRNHNGISEPDELQRLCDTDIAAISLSYRSSRRTDRFGNEFRQRGTIERANGRTEAIFDIWLTRTR